MRLLAAALNASKPDGVREIYPGFGSVYVEWDDARLSNERAEGVGGCRAPSARAGVG